MVDPAEHSDGFTSAEASPRRDRDWDWDWTSLLREAHAEARRVLDDSRADDAAQEAAIRAWRHQSACIDSQRPAPWVRAIARREALRLVARERATTPLSELDLLSAPDESDLSDLGVSVRAALEDTCDLVDRRLLFYRYWEGLTDPEIASITGMPVGTVKTRLYRARNRLRAWLPR